MEKKINIGDIIEIKTSKGLAYVQYTHEFTTHPKLGSLIRVLPGIYEKRPKNFKDIASQHATFVIFLTLQHAVDENHVEIVDNQPIPLDAQILPIFRCGIPDPESKKVEVWSIWDSKKEWKVGASIEVRNLTDEQKRLPILEIIGDELLAERIVSGWTPENDPGT